MEKEREKQDAAIIHHVRQENSIRAARNAHFSAALRSLLLYLRKCADKGYYPDNKKMASFICETWVEDGKFIQGEVLAESFFTQKNISLEDEVELPSDIDRKIVGELFEFLDERVFDTILEYGDETEMSREGEIIISNAKDILVAKGLLNESK
jgi:hypothetical protein